MPNTLTVSSKQSSFPYAAIAIAAYTKTADIIFDDSISGFKLVLAVDGTPLTQEEDIVQALAKEGGLSSDSEKVFCPSSGVTLSELALDILVFHSFKNTAFSHCFPRDRVYFRFPG